MVSEKDTHGLAMSLAWAFLLDLGIFAIQLFKHRAKTRFNYMLIHGIFATIAWLASSFGICYLIYYWGFIQKEDNLSGTLHVKIGHAVLFLSTLQFLGGIVLYKMINSNRVSSRQRVIKNAHKYHGYFLWIATKFNLAIGAYFGGYEWEISLGIYGIVLLLIHILIQSILFISEKKIRKPNLKTSPVPEHELLLSGLNAGKTKKELKKQFPNIKWVIFGNRVYDLTNFVHPGGSFIINHVLGREISRFLYGGYPIESATFKPHRHSNKAFNMLESYYIGDISNYESILQNTKLQESVSQTTTVIDIHKKENAIAGDQDTNTSISRPLISLSKLEGQSTTSAIWKLNKRQMLNQTTARLDFRSTNFVIRNLGKQNSWFGRHFNIRFADEKISNKVRTYTTAVTLNESNQILQKEIFRVFKALMGDEQDVSFEIATDFNEPQQDLSLFIKRYPFPTGLSKIIHDCDLGQNFIIEGPYGRGLELALEPKGCHYLFAAGTGILPFVDFLFMYAWKVLIDAIKKEKGVEVAKKLNPLDINFDNLFGDMSVQLFAAFPKKEDAFIFELIELLSNVDKTYKLGRFKCYLSCYESESITKIESRFNTEVLRGKVETDGHSYYICGPPGFNQSVPKALEDLGCHKEDILLV